MRFSPHCKRLAERIRRSECPYRNRTCPGGDVNRGLGMNAVANNTANLNTDGFREYEVYGVEDQGSAKPQARRSPNPGPDVVGNAIEMKSAYLMYMANMKVVERSDEMLGSTMDLLA